MTQRGNIGVFLCSPAGAAFTAHLAAADRKRKPPKIFFKREVNAEIRNIRKIEETVAVFFLLS